MHYYNVYRNGTGSRTGTGTGTGTGAGSGTGTARIAMLPLTADAFPPASPASVRVRLLPGERGGPIRAGWEEKDTFKESH